MIIVNPIKKSPKIFICKTNLNFSLMTCAKYGKRDNKLNNKEIQGISENVITFWYACCDFILAAYILWSYFLKSSGYCWWSIEFYLMSSEQYHLCSYEYIDNQL